MENDLLNLWQTMDKKYEKYRPRLLKSNELLFNFVVLNIMTDK